MNQLPKDLPDCTIFLLAKAYQAAHAMFKERLQPYGLTNLQHLVLEGLWFQEGITAADLSKLLIFDKATLSGVLDRMLESDWISKIKDSNDKRLIRLYPSEKANVLKPELIRLRRQANEHLLSGFTKEEQVLFKRLLRDLV